MKGCNTWSYHPYHPFLWEVGDIYICRVVPYENAIHLEWLQNEKGCQGTVDCADTLQLQKESNNWKEAGCSSEAGCHGGKISEYEVLYRKRGEEEFIFAGTVAADSEKEYGEYTIENLETEVDYEFLVRSGEMKSRVRLARTGKSVGTVVNYLHPEDDAYAYSGKYLCSPSIVRHPDGYLLASMDVHVGAAPQNLTFIYRSDDNGQTWHYVSDLMPSFWGKMFIHNGELYMLSCSTEYGDLLIGKSTDGGRNFSAPVVLLRGSNGKKGNLGVHKNPQNIMRYNGRIYETLEWGSWENKEYCHAAMVMSCDEKDDLLVPENWSFTEPRVFDHFAEEVADLPIPTMTIEGTLAVSPAGKLLNIMRFGKRGHAIAYEVNTSNHEAQLTYSQLINFPANFSKFMIKFDEVSGKYYSVATRLYEGCNNSARNYLTLMASENLTDWQDVCVLQDYRHEDWHQIGFQYVDFEFEGEDIIYLCRTAMNGAHNFHDSNYSTFHRIENFRKL